MLASKIFTRTRLMGAKIHYFFTILLYRVTELHMKKKLLPLSLSFFFTFFDPLSLPATSLRLDIIYASIIYLQ